MKAGNGSPLTDQQRTLLQLIADGCQQPEAARRMNLSYHTVRRHMDGVFYQLNVHTTAAAVAKGFREGWLH